MFVREKSARGHTYLYLVENEREGGRVRQRIIRALGRKERLQLCFGDSQWDEEKVLDRYELLYEAGLVEEALRDGREAARVRKKLPVLGESMRFDHRRIVATAIARLRAKLKYRPVVFERVERTGWQAGARLVAA